MASGPITSWQIDGETMETVTNFIFLGSKITAYGDCSHKIKRRLLLGRKVMTNLDSIRMFSSKSPKVLGLVIIMPAVSSSISSSTSSGERTPCSLLLTEMGLKPHMAALAGLVP